MICNSKITAWYKQTGFDINGQPKREKQKLNYLINVASEPLQQSLKVGDKSIITSCKIHVPGVNPGIKIDDVIEVDFVEYKVVNIIAAPGANAALSKTIIVLS